MTLAIGARDVATVPRNVSCHGDRMLSAAEIIHALCTLVLALAFCTLDFGTYLARFSATLASN